VYERKFTYTSTTHTSTAAYAGNVGKRKNYKTKKMQKQIPRAVKLKKSTPKGGGKSQSVGYATEGLSHV